MNGLQAVYHVAEHFGMHYGQILYITKLLRGEDLGFYRELDNGRVEKVRNVRKVEKWERRRTSRRATRGSPFDGTASPITSHPVVSCNTAFPRVAPKYLKYQTAIG